MTVLRVRRADTDFRDRRRRYKVVLDGQVVGQSRRTELSAFRYCLAVTSSLSGSTVFGRATKLWRPTEALMSRSITASTRDWGALVVFVRPRSYLLLTRE